MRKLIALPVICLALSACGPFQPNHAEKSACLTMNDLNELGFGAEIDRTKEHWFGIRGIGTQQLLYDYNHSVRDGRGIVMIHCEATKQRTGLEAMATYRMSMATAQIVAMSDIDQKLVVDGGCKGADACRLIGFYVRDELVGSQFAIRVGSQVVAVTVMGTAFDDIEEWHDLVAKKVEVITRTDS